MTIASPTRDLDEIAAAFWGKVQYGEGCWAWLGEHDQRGYGRFTQFRAHRVAYELAVGPIPPGLVLDHLCRNTRCVNPAHLELAQRSRIALPCPRCGLPLGRVLDSRPVDVGHRRRRICAAGHRATTYEYVMSDIEAA